MTDFMSAEQRSAQMSKIRSKNTKPELRLRTMLHAEGYRYRLHERKLPGQPDLVFPGRKKVIFVNGCFWHAHACPAGLRLPKSNTEFWDEKRRRTQERDAIQLQQLETMGWEVMVVWECQTTTPDMLEEVKAFLG